MRKNLLTFIIIALISAVQPALVFCYSGNLLVSEAFAPISDVSGDSTLGDDIKLFPNPAGDHFSLENASKVRGIEIINVVGKTVKIFGEITSYDNFYIGDLTTGLYMVRVVDMDGKVMKTIRLHKK